MTYRSILFSTAALLAPLTPALAQEAQTAPAASTPAAPTAAEGATTTQPVTAPAESAPAASTPAAQPADEYSDDEEIVITGAKARGSVVGDIPPENTLDARDVRATGATSISELLDALAPQLGSSQGRSAGRPVLLLNGQRISGFRELRDIPTEAIQRVEILPEEVSLKYGYRADQKVVNIVLRQRFRSTTAQVGAGVATDGGYTNGNVDLTRFLVQRNGRTTYNLHAEGNSLLTENERNVLLNLPANDPSQSAGTTEQQLQARSLIGRKRDVRGSVTINRNIFGNVSATGNVELEHVDGLALIGLNPTLLDPLARKTSTDTAHVGGVLNGTTKSQWRWTLTGNADLERDITRTDRDSTSFPTDRARETTASADLTATANGKLFKLPAGDASTTLTAGVSTVHLDSTRNRGGSRSESSLSRSVGTAGINVDLPISRRNSDFSALGNLTLNANAEVDQLSDFGTLTKVGAGANWSPVDRLNLLTSFTREEGPPSINQLGDPVLDTPGSRIFDFTTGQTVLVDAITGGNPNLQADRRNVWKLSANWQPFEKTDLRLRADYVHTTIKRPISNITVTQAIQDAFPDRFQRCTVVNPDAGCFTVGQLRSVDLTPVNFDSARKDTLRLGFDFSKPLKSRRPSQAVIDEFRKQFGLPPRTAQGGAPGGPPSAGGSAPPPPADGAAPPSAPAEGAGGPPRDGGGRGFGGGGRGGGFGGFGGPGGQNRGRLTFSLTDTITFVDKVRIAPGAPELDYLNGDASGSTGGTPRHNVQAQVGYFNNGLGARLVGNYRSGTTVNTLTGDDLHFSPLATFDLKLFANPGDIPEIALKHAWLRGTQVRFEINNIFNTRPSVRDATGGTPFNYQPGLLDPLGRTVMISFRKLFLPPPSFFRQRFQQQQQSGAATR